VLGEGGVAGYTTGMTLEALGRHPLRLPILVLTSLSIGLAGCGGSGKPKKDVAYVARDVDTLYITAKQRMDDGDPKQAAALFDEVERQHPYSPWARRAQLMGAFSYYLARDYAKSVQAAQRFISVHPGNKDAPYAYYLVALCYYEQISDVSRDQKDTRQALDALTEVMRRYPNTQYATDAKVKLDLVNDHLAGKEMEVGRFYEHSGKWLAGTIRFRTVIDKYQETSHTPEALYRLVESYLAMGIPAEAQKSAAVLGANYPGSPWYRRAYVLMNAKAPGTKAS
jgi:outer membrane protein assembly factor BamD